MYNKQMSTGDQTEYLRSKMAERNRPGKTATFSSDGYDRWAESERPARVGGAEKIPAERQMMTSRTVGGSCGGAMHGGISAQDFIGLVPGLFDFFNKAKQFTALVKEDLRNPDIMPEKYRKSGEMIASTLEKIGLGKDPHVAMYESCMHHSKPKHKRGGAADWTAWFKELGDKLKLAYDWFLKNKPAIHAILKMKSLNPPGFDYAKQLEGFMTNVGLGKKRHSRRGGYDVSMQPMNAQESRGVPAQYPVQYDDSYPETDESAPSVRRSSGPKSKASMGSIAKEASDGKCGCSGGSDQTRYARVIEMYNNLPSSGKQRDDWIHQHQSVLNVLKSKGLIGGSVQSRHARANMRGGEWWDDAGNAAKSAFGIGKPKRAPSARGIIVKRVMAEQGLSLPQASKYVKEHNLY